MRASVTQWIITQRHLVVTRLGSSPQFTVVMIQALWVKPNQHILSTAKLTPSHKAEMLICQVSTQFNENLLLSQQPPLLVQNPPFQTGREDAVLAPNPQSQWMVFLLEEHKPQPKFRAAPGKTAQVSLSCRRTALAEMQVMLEHNDSNAAVPSFHTSTWQLLLV